MATEADKFKVGIFLIAGFLLLNGALVWIGASHVLEKTARYVTYFDESVHGLDVGAAVKFRGVAVGRVVAIRVAPDGRLVEVDMDVDQGFRVPPGLRAGLAVSGLTGMNIVELGFPREGAAPALALSFTPPDRYIPSQASLLTSLADALTGIAADLRGTDLPGLVADYRAAAVTLRQRLAAPEVDTALARVAAAADSLETLTRKVAALAEDPRVPRALENLSVSAERMAAATGSAERVFGDPRIPQTLDDTRAAAAALRSTLEEARGEIAALHAGERLDTVQRRIAGTLDGVDASARTAAAGVRDTAAAATRTAERWERLAADLDRSLQAALVRLERAAGRFEGLATSVEANPSRLLEKPPKEDFR